MKVVNHDGHTDCVELGITARGTPMRVHRCVLDADLVVATGCLRPHYFAGFGAGAKAIFPGLGEQTAIRINHRWKTAAGARAGNVDENPCRDDLEEAVAMVPTPMFLLNGVCGPDDQVRAAVAGDVVRAFRFGATQARSWFVVNARPAPLVIASDGLPVSASLYQAAKIAAAAAPLVAPNGTLVVAAECAEGIEPLEVVNEAIFRIGVLPRLAPGVQLVLVSSRSQDEVTRTLLTHAPSVDSVLARMHDARTLIIPRASRVIAEAAS
jgi:nickel-dependent lactate racemase